MSVDRIRRPANPFEGEVDLDGLADFRDRQLNAPDPRLAAEFAYQIRCPIDPFRRQVRIEQERPPAQLRMDRRTRRERPLELPLADVTPGTPRIEDYLDSHPVERCSCPR